LLTFFVQDFLQDVATKTVPDTLHISHLLPPSLRRQKEKKKKKEKSAFNLNANSNTLESSRS